MFLKFIDKQADLISELNPDRIYVENVRSILHIPKKAAKLLCELAVKDKVFRKRYGAYCNSCGRLLKTYNRKSEIEDFFTCEICQNLEEEKYEFTKDEIEIIEFYQLLDERSYRTAN
ncbi:hypothetical protein MWU58_02885 [Flavobacteriaceae bacterium S0825]|uniref:hypothetical protein n=1 Tax=Gaetbulibacter sp. S0825 TaxID=2720084 RepID=UPI001430EA5F|nr:hypothetical protein [Gaetbulibacter sp. S0825]MCK0108224.1 hypothetical protein [Flavobacteriaceae bacterium S0825]NIX63860.1 hypothetical protein [Gaetbulibacter sp. S0825]